jgi:hypothetical protein
MFLSTIFTTTQPTTDSPQAFQRAYRDAVRSQDADAVRALFLVRSPGEQATVDVMVANELDAARLEAAVEQTFGVKLVGGGTLAPPIESDAWVIEGDVANIPLRDIDIESIRIGSTDSLKCWPKVDIERWKSSVM